MKEILAAAAVIFCLLGAISVQTGEVTLSKIGDDLTILFNDVVPGE